MSGGINRINKNQRMFAANLQKSYFENEEKMLDVLNALESETLGASSEELLCVEEIARDTGRLLHRWQRSSHMAIETMSQLLSEQESLDLERKKMEAILNHRDQALVAAFEDNSYINDVGIKLQQRMKSTSGRPS